MKLTPRQFLVGSLLACLCMPALAAMADDTPPAAPEKTTPTSTAASSVSTSSTAPSSSATSSAAVQETPPPASAPATTSSATPEPAAATEIQPAAAEPAPAAPSTGATDSAAVSTPSTSATDSQSPLRRIDGPEKQPTKPARSHRRPPQFHSGDNDRVGIFSNVSLGRDETASNVVAILGNATSEGKVDDTVVAVLGNNHVTGVVGGDVVAVLGNLYVNTKVNDAVAVLGNVELGPNAEVAGDVVCVGGTVKRDPKAIVHGDIPNVSFGPILGAHFEGLQSYFQNCLLKLRLLAVAPHLGWAWIVAGAFLLLYVLIALIAPGAVDKTIVTLETRPGGTILASFLSILLTPVLIVILVMTVVGIAVVPFVAIGLMCATLFGHAVILAWLGRRITGLFGAGAFSPPAVATLIGGVIVLALYLVPVVGLIVYKLIGVLGVGVVVYTLLLASKRNKPIPAVPASASTPPPAVSTAVGSELAGTEAVPGSTAPSGGVAAMPVGAGQPPLAVATLPRAGFWIRTAALALDALLVGILCGIIGDAIPHALHTHFGPGGFMLVLAAYGAVMWKVKSTTIGGIVCGLRVVRLDHRAIDWSTAIVRALSCFISIFAIGLGFIWVAIDEEKQSWHDKIAGTTVVQVRGSQSLV